MRGFLAAKYALDSLLLHRNFRKQEFHASNSENQDIIACQSIS